MSNPTDHISSDDAALFSINTPNDDTDGDQDDREDPIGRNASHTGQLDMFVSPLPKQPKNRVRGGARGPGSEMQLTPGARRCPEIGIAPQKLA